MALTIKSLKQDQQGKEKEKHLSNYTVKTKNLLKAIIIFNWVTGLQVLSFSIHIPYHGGKIFKCFFSMTILKLQIH